ncbi:alpha/beta hydrolase [Shewanella sp. 10N.286.52.B9]|uniref:alpha/beta fold hydrolase n=1 Tax=Shewanella sp. 10N.286.52.B9 TaxID=1880837 RepID=UPI000C84C5C6|nr:alpha/beta hydrolase [Shewanella sp. 10N.286.52.B9]PMG42720.1 hypothetical protein BCU91_07180 [Shewanella sp. 10N.286.52.B9]
MKKIIIRILVIVLVVLSPILYLAGTFVFTGPMPDDEFQQQLPTIVKNLEVKMDGEGEETIVMIHGYPDSLELWDKQVEYLKQDYRIARFTLPGFELEDNGQRPDYNIQQIRMIMDAFIESLDRDKVTVLAHDWGASYASHYLAQNDLVDRLILLDIGSYGNEKSPSINVKYTFALALAWVLPEYLGEKLTLFTAENILKLEQNVDANKKVANLRSDARMTYPYWHLWNAILSKDLPQRVAVEDFGTPFLFIYGKDKNVWFHGKEWLQQVVDLNKGQVEVVPGGHWFMESSADLVNQTVDDWIRAN